MYRESATNNVAYIHRPEAYLIDSLDSERFLKLQQDMQDDGMYLVMPMWNPDAIRIEVDGEDLVKLDSQFINLPKPINAKTRYYTGEMALFIIMNYTVNL